MDPNAVHAVDPRRDQELEAWLERALRTPARRPDPEPVVRDLDD